MFGPFLGGWWWRVRPPRPAGSSPVEPAVDAAVRAIEAVERREAVVVGSGGRGIRREDGTGWRKRREPGDLHAAERGEREQPAADGVGQAWLGDAADRD